VRFAPGFAVLLAVVLAGLTACAGLPNRDPLTIDVAGIEPLPGEGLELRLAVSVRIQNPNDRPVEYRGAALRLELNDLRLASGVSDRVGTVPRYGEAVFVIPVTISAFDMARQVLGLVNSSGANEVRYRVRGKLEGGLFGTRRFVDEGTFELNPQGQRPAIP
jgi:LEA14-like dessication related protein